MNNVRVLKRILSKGSEFIFHELSYTVEIEDEAAGEFVVIRRDDEKLSIDPEDWKDLKKLIDKMIKECRE